MVLLRVLRKWLRGNNLWNALGDYGHLIHPPKFTPLLPDIMLVLLDYVSEKWI